MKALLGTKLGMTQLFDENGNVARVTLIEAGPCVVTQLKTEAIDGYSAVQIGFGKAKHVAKPQAGHMKAAGVEARFMREIRVDSADETNPAVGDSLDASIFEVGDKIQVTGTSKGKGFAGVIKRHNFATGRKTHGSQQYRGHGSIGSGYPQHVFKGIGMAGHMGTDRVTVTGLKVVAVDVAANIVAVSGAVPGPRKGLVMIKQIKAAA